MGENDTRADERLTELHRSGRLVSRYPEVRALLADLAGPELDRAGRLLARLDPDEVLREHPDTPSLTVALTGHGTVAPLAPSLTAELARHGMLARVSVSDFDSWVFDLGDPGSALYAARPDLVCCLLDPMVVVDELPSPWRPGDVERIAMEKVALAERLAVRFRSAGHGTLVLNTLPQPRWLTAQLVDLASRARIGVIWREANARLLRAAGDSVVVLDLDPLIGEGVPVRDARLSRYAKAHLSPALLAAYARETAHLARQLSGRTKKTLVLDLDGTVWGGVLGDDGPEGIEVADGYRGEAFRDFQRVVKQLGSQGVLLAAVSKNDLEPVLAVFHDHPDMTLREDDFVRIVANWRPKHDNLAALATALNLDADSFVFVDDSAYECGLVRREMPGVAVVPVGADPALHAEALLRDSWFDVRELTDEDRARVSTYRDELVRQDFLDSFESIEDYLRELDVRVILASVTDADVARVSQITLRTNQFNLTTRRMRPDDVRAYAAEPGNLVMTVRSADRFGENGLVGVVFVRREGDEAHVDNFLLSCRVFSRGVEQAALSALLTRARAAGVVAVNAAYRATAKNGKVREFYPRNGFTRAGDDGETLTFRHDLVEILEPPAHVTLTDEAAGLDLRREGADR
jgi:FkbH-like protein